MYSNQDLSGKQYKHWTVSGFSHNHKGRKYWNVQCNNCSIAAVKATARVNLDLRCSNCNFRPRGESGMRHLYAVYRTTARDRSLEFNLTLEEFRVLTSKECTYCGVSPTKTETPRKLTNGTDWSDYNWNGIDRVDNKVGYIPSNCVPCCSVCNLAKRELTVQEFVAHIMRIAAHIGSTGVDNLFNEHLVAK